MKRLEHCINEIVNSTDCMKCRGCCWFSAGEEHLLPFFAKREFDNLDFDEKQKVYRNREGFYQARSVMSKNMRGGGGVKICFFLDEEPHKCSVYEKRPLDCVLWPFDIIKVREGKESRIFLSVVTEEMCPATKSKEDIVQHSAQRIIQYLKEAGVFEEICNDSRHVWQPDEHLRLIQELNVYMHRPQKK